ncbi:MAG: sensor histidine kinase [Butyrivibrio sp.]|nr:sensor histidine kinase [Butyrivibrio sp.]
MSKLSDSFKATRIRSKLILSQVLIALIPFVLVGMVGIMFSVREARKNVEQRTSQTVNQVSRTLDIYMEDLDKLTFILADEIAMENPAEGGTERLTRVSHYMQNVMSNYDEIAGILYAYEGDRYISTGMTRVSRDSFQKESWYKKALSDKDTLHRISSVTGRNITTDVGYSVDDVFSVVKAVNDPSTGDVLGVLLMDVGHGIISSAISDSQTGGEGFVFVLDESDHVVYTPINDVVYRIRPDWLSEKDGTLNIKVGGGRYHVRYKTSERTGWKTVSVISYDALMSDIDRMIAIYAVMLIVTLVLVQYLSLKLSDNITQPIQNLRDLMKKTEEGNLSLRFESDSKDEINDLGLTFNHMLERIQLLLERVRHEEDQKRMAELKIVQEQFKPHFLYNTLDTINWMAREHDAKDIVKLVEALTNVFRISLSHGRDYITIKEEVNYINNYLYVQKTRYEDKLIFDVEADEECMKTQVPKLILQPLLENAIYHGIKLKRGSGHIKVSVKRQGDMIRMSVSDDGRGMDENTRDSLRNLLQTGSGRGDLSPDDNQSFGLYYVRERLQLRYGENYRVDVDSTIDVGTEISICIPFGGED